MNDRGNKLTTDTLPGPRRTGPAHGPTRARARTWPRATSLAAALLALGLSAAPLAAAPTTTAPAATAAGKLAAAVDTSTPSLAAVDELLRGWRAAEAGHMLDELRRRGMPEALLNPSLGVVRFYEGNYAKAEELLAGLPDGDLKRAVVAARELTAGMKEVPTPDGHWRIRVHPGPDEVLLPLMLEALPRIRSATDAVFDTSPRSPIVVEVYGSTEDLARATGLTAKQIEDSGTIAICKFNRIMITTPRATVKGYSWLTTLSHEYVHLLVNHRTFQRVPIWLHEGLARYNESRWEGHPQRLDPDTEALLLGALGDDQLITFDEMSPSMALLPTQRHTELAFAEVLSVIDLLYRKVGQAGVNRVLDRLARRETEEARTAIAAELGYPFARFEKSWKEDLRTRRPPRLAGKLNLPTIRFKKADRDPLHQELDEVDRKARDYAYLGQLLRGQSRPKAALAEYKKAAGYSSGFSPVIQNWIAATLLDLGQAREALAALTGVADRAPSYSPTYIHEGLALAALKDDARARQKLEAALAINPFDPRIFQQLLRIYTAADDPRAEQARQALGLLGGADGDPGLDDGGWKE